MLAYIEDGYTERGYLAGAEGLCPALSLTYRPALPSEVNEYFRRVEAAKPEEVEAVAATWAAMRICSWDVKDKGNISLLATPDNVRRLRPRLFFRLLKCLRGEEPWDVDPATTAEAIERELREREEAKKAGLSVADWRARRDAKN